MTELRTFQKQFVREALAPGVDAGPAGIGSLTKLRRMVKGKESAIDAAIEELIRAGYLLQTKHGQANIYTSTDTGAQWTEGKNSPHRVPGTG